MERFKSISVELAVAEELSKKYGGVVVRKKDGFVLLYKKICDDDCKKVLIWIRKSPITEKAVDYMKRVLSRVAHDEVWLLKLYVEPDFTEAYKELVNKEFTKNEIEEYLARLQGSTATS